MAELKLTCTERNQSEINICQKATTAKWVTKSIPFSLSLRIVRICTNPDTRDTRLQELKTLLTDRNYSPFLLDLAIARSIPRNKALHKIIKKGASKQPIFALKYDPCTNTALTQMLLNANRTCTMTHDQLPLHFMDL